MGVRWLVPLAMFVVVFSGCTTAPQESPDSPGPPTPSTATPAAPTDPVTLTYETPVCDDGHPAVRLNWNAATGSNVWYGLGVLDATGSRFGVSRDSLTGLTFYHESMGESGGQRLIAGSSYTYTLTIHNDGDRSIVTVTVEIPSSICTANRPPPRDAGVQWDIASNVPEKDLQTIRYGLATAGDFLNAHLGGDMPADFRNRITVKVVATGRGNDAPEGGGACCTGLALDTDLPRPFFDVAHPNWSDQGVWLWPNAVGSEKAVVHEYTHGWQSWLGCINVHEQPLGMWLNEGIAEQVAYAAMIDQGVMLKSDVVSFMEYSAKDPGSGEWDQPLINYSMTQAPRWPGHIGFLALEMAMNGTANGLMALRTICTEVAAGATREAAFKTAFGVELDQFYEDFQVWKDTGRAPPRDTGVQWDVASNVPEQDLQAIRYGLATAGDFLNAHLGGDIPADVRSHITVKVVATGQGNQEPGGGGSCCTAASTTTNPPGGARPFFDVAHPHWSQPSSLWSPDIGNEATAAHEYAHAWQISLGCSGVLGGWLDEGIAQQVSYAAMTEQGFIDKATTAAFMESSAKDRGTEGKQWNTPLSEVDAAGVWPGHIGYLALEVAMNGTSNGLMGLRTICTEVAAGATREAAFKTAFGIELPEFYQKFEDWKAAQPT